MNQNFKNKPISKLVKPKYSFRSCCWNCHQPGHIGAKCRFPKQLKCSICKKPNVKTSDCNCRSEILKGIATKKYCEPLRVQHTPMRLVIDVKILADNFIATVNPGDEKSKVNEAIIQYLRLANIKPKSDRSIDIDIRIQRKKFKINCVVQSNLDAAMSLGCKDSLKIGILFEHHEVKVHKFEGHPNPQNPNLLITIENDLIVDEEQEEGNDIESNHNEDEEEILNIMWDDTETLE